MIKRILACLLSISMIFGGIYAFAAVEETVYDAAGSDVTLLTELGIINESYTADMSGTILKSDFIVILMNLIKAPLRPTAANTYFTDVSRSAPYATAIEYAAEHGYVVGAGNSAFGVNDTIALQDAAKVILKAVDYDYLAEASGGYPTGYISVARMNNLFRGVGGSMTDALTKSGAVTLFANVLDMDAVSIVYSGNRDMDDGHYQKTNETVLERIWDITLIEEVVTANYYTSLSDPNGGKINHVALGGVSYYTENGGINDYLGCNVRGYVREGHGEEPELMFVIPRKTTVTAIDTEDLLPDECKVGTIAYQQDSDRRSKIERVDAVPYIIYNERAYPAGGINDMIGANGTLVLIDNNNDGVADVVLINDFETLFVDGVSTSNMTVRNQYTYAGAAEDVTLDGVDNVTIVKDGTPIEATKITRNDVVLLKRSKGTADPSLYLEVTSKAVSGKVDGVSNDGLYGSLQIDGTSYELSKTFKDALNANDYKAGKYELGQTGTIYLDSRDRVVGFSKETESGTLYGYLKQVGFRGNFRDEILLRVLGTDRDWHTYETAERLSVNGSVIKKENFASVEGLFNNGILSPQVIEYTLNGEGKVKTIWTAIESNDYREPRFHYQVLDNMEYHTANAAFASQVYIDSENVTFYIPRLHIGGMYTDEELARVNDRYFYALSGTKGYSDWGYYTLKAYNCDMYGVTKLIVREDGVKETMGTFDINRFVFREMEETVDTEGNLLRQMNGIYGINTSQTITCSDDFILLDEEGNEISIGTLRSGDILNLSFDAENKAASATISFASANAPTAMSAFTGNLHQDRVVLFGEVEEIDAESGHFLFNDGAEKIKSLRVKTSDVSVFICDTEKNYELSIGSITDVQKGSYLYIAGGQSSYGFIMIYK